MDARQTSSQSGRGTAETLADDEPLPLGRSGGLERGEQLDRYVVLDRLGAGAMGLVYAAYDPKLDRRVALKLLHVRAGPEVGSRRGQRLLREAQAMAQLTHPNVVTVHDVGTADGRVFLAMEYVQGRTLTQWLEDGPGWREVLDVFVAAGRGLIAAHAKGLVHRDFKPDNVMMGDDGRVRVMDFGLARAGDDSLSMSSGVTSDPPMQVTHTGAVMGTPAYMAPEQHLGRAVDARSDQFAFCVALYEGLYGERPFAGHTPMALGLAVTKGLLREPPAGRSIPKWLRRVVLRGLQTEPRDRFMDMSQLLHVLQDDPVLRRRRTMAWAGGGGALLLAGGLAWGLRPSSEESLVPCRDTAAHLDGRWDDARVQRVTQAFTDSDSAMATDTLVRVRDRLDRYTDAWVQMRTDNCRATRVHGDQSEELLDLRNACLDRRLRQVEDVVTMLEQADADVVQRAVTLVAALPSVDDCADVVALREGLPTPADATAAEQVERLRERMGRAQALSYAGRYDEAAVLVAEIREQAVPLDYPPVLTETDMLEGELRIQMGEPAVAERLLQRAFFSALRIRHDDLAARAAARLVYVVGYQLARHADGATWGQHALSLGLRVGEGQLAEAEAHHSLGVLADAAGDDPAAGEHHQRAYELRTRLLPPDHPGLARSLNALGNVHLDRGEYDQALGRYREALELREKVFGPGHPAVAGTLNNVSIILRRKKDFSGAVEALERAVRIYESSNTGRPALARAFNNLGLVLRESGDPIAAEAQHRRALELRERMLGPEHPDLGDSLTGLARALSDQGRHDEAEPLLTRALQMYERSFGPDHPAVAEALVGLGVMHHGQGAMESARRSMERAVAIFDVRTPDTAEADEARAWLERIRAADGTP